MHLYETVFTATIKYIENVKLAMHCVSLWSTLQRFSAPIMRAVILYENNQMKLHTPLIIGRT
jgi:hypothetical protein